MCNFRVRTTLDQRIIDDFNIFAVQFKALKDLQKFRNWAYVGPLDACSNEQLSDKNDIFVIFNN